MKAKKTERKAATRYVLISDHRKERTDPNPREAGKMHRLDIRAFNIERIQTAGNTGRIEAKHVWYNNSNQEGGVYKHNT